MKRGYERRRDPATGEDYIAVALRGADVLKRPILNKASAFDRRERSELQLAGLLPDSVDDVKVQIARVQAQMDLKTTNLGRHIYLNGLMDRNTTLFYRYLVDHLEELVPIIYTPTVAEASLHWSRIFRRSRGLYITPRHRVRMADILRRRPYGERPIIVATDNERILGIGDQGAGGMGIPIGKLALYTAGAGIHPDRTVPVCLDVGTNNEELLADPLYVGYRNYRLRGPEYEDFIAEFVAAVQEVFPGALLQWEDFANTTSFNNLERFREELPSFNDDIQGTAAMTVAGLLAASRAAHRSIADHKVVILGAGSAGIGIHEQTTTAMVDAGLSPEQARRRVFVLDSKGLVVEGRTDLTPAKRSVAVDGTAVASWPGGPDWTLQEVVTHAKPTALIGVSGQPGAFDESVVRAAAADMTRPIIMPMSNPTSHAEVTPEQVTHWTDGRALVATGSPFPPVHFDGRRRRIGQANNMFIFPGMGLGALAARATTITDGMFLAAAKALAAALPDEDLAQGALYPHIESVRGVSRAVATAVFAQAMAEGVGEPTEDIDAAIDAEIWFPEYVPYRAV